MENKKPRVLVLSDPLFRPSGYGNTNLAQLPFLSKEYEMGYMAWGWNGFNPTPKELMSTFPNAEFFPCIGEYHGKDVIHAVIDNFKPDILLLHGDIYMFADTMINELVRYRGKICQIALFPIDGENIPPKWIPFMEKLDGLITLTEFGKKETEKAVKAPVRISPLGIDPMMFYPITKEEKIKLRNEKFTWMKDRFVITWIGRNFSRKNPGLAIMGFSQFVKKCKAKDALLYMHCADNDPAGNSILEIVKRDFPNVVDQVCLPQGFNPGVGVNRKLLAELVQCSDVGLNTSLGEGVGLFSPEAMGCGIPVISPAHSACMEIIGKNSERGELIEIAASFHASNNILQHIGKPESLANCLGNMYNNKNRRDKKAQAGYEWAKNYTWENSSISLIENINYFHDIYLNDIKRSIIEVI